MFRVLQQVFFVLLLIAANWNLKHTGRRKWNDFFEKPPVEDFPEKDKEVEIKTNVSVFEGITSHLTKKEDAPVEELETTVVPEEIKKEVNELLESEIPEIQVDEPTKDWEPELYKRVQKKIEFDSAGRRITPVTEEELNPPTKTQSFLNKVQSVFSSPSVKSAIEKDVEKLQEKK